MTDLKKGVKVKVLTLEGEPTGVVVSDLIDQDVPDIVSDGTVVFVELAGREHPPVAFDTRALKALTASRAKRAR